jgi:microcystin-dependent protein
MSDPFLGSLMLVSFDYAPKGWALCNGQLMALAQNQALFSLLGTTFGGNGQTTFALPDLRGRYPISSGQGPGLSTYNLGQPGGSETITLTSATSPTHTHLLNASTTNAAASSPSGAVPATTANITLYAQGIPASGSFDPSAVSQFGGSLPHTNLRPVLTMNWVIALVGIFPSRN